MSAADLEKQRALFEAWLSKDEAEFFVTGIAWRAWQAALDTQATQGEPTIDKSQVKRMATQMGWTPPVDGPSLDLLSYALQKANSLDVAISKEDMRSLLSAAIIHQSIDAAREEKP